MSLLIPIIGAGALISAFAFGGKKKNSGSGSDVPETIDESSLLIDTSSVDPSSAIRDPSTMIPVSTPTSVPASASTSKASTTASKPAAKVSSQTSTSATTTKVASAKWPNYPKVLFSASKVGSFSPSALVTKVQNAIKTKNLLQITAAYKEFLSLNNDQLRFFHNKYYDAYKVTPYVGLSQVKLPVGQQYLGNILAKLNNAGVGSVPKEKI